MNKLPAVEVGTAGVNVTLLITIEGKQKSFSAEKKRKKKTSFKIFCILMNTEPISVCLWTLWLIMMIN